MPTPFSRSPSQPHSRTRIAGPLIPMLLAATLLSPANVSADGQQNPIIAGMEAMLDAMGYEQKSRSPFPDEDPFGQMPWPTGGSGTPWSTLGSTPGMSPWSSLGGMPGMSPWSSLGGMPGMSPWSSLGGMPGMSPWSSLGGMPGMSPFGSGMPGAASPWNYAKPQDWRRFMGKDMLRFLRPGDPDSPTHQLDGLWIGQNGERLWFRNGWLRVYRDVASDARALSRGPYLFIGIPETKQVLQYEYGIRGDYLGLRDADGNMQLFRRYR